MAQNQKSYNNEFKAQAVKLSQEIGGHKTAQELGIPKGTMYTWIKTFKEGRLSANEAIHTPGGGRQDEGQNIFLLQGASCFQASIQQILKDKECSLERSGSRRCHD